MKRLLLLLSGLALAGGLIWSDASMSADEKAVHAAVLDYVEGVYNVQPERIERSVHKDMRKHGFWKDQQGNYREIPMTQPQLVALSKNWNKDGTRANDQSPKKITIFEVKDKTASAKLVAEWGQDYFHLAKYEDTWMITNVIWQSIPEEDKRN